MDYQRAEQLLVDQVAWIPIGSRESLVGSRSYLQGFQVAATGQTPLDIWQTMYIARH